MAMTACYRNFDMSHGLSNSHQLVASHTSNRQNNGMSLQTLQTALSPALSQLPTQPQKDYSIPLHVDCSVEYELPNQAKPPVGARVEPLLMIHPCYFRKMESQRRSPFINNMPTHINQNSNISSNSIDSPSSSRSQRQYSSSSSLSRHHTSTSSSSSSASSALRSSQHHQQQINLQQQIDEYVQRQLAQMSSQQSSNIYSSSIRSNQSSSQLSHSQSLDNNHFLGQSQRTSSAWDPYTSVTHNHNKKLLQHQQQQKLMVDQHTGKHISNNVFEGGGLLCTGRWIDTIEKSASMAAIPRDYQSGPENIPHVKKNATNIYRHTVGKRDAMLSGGYSTYGSDNNKSTDITFTSALWKPESQESNTTTTSKDAVITNTKSSSSNNILPSNAIINNNNQNNHNIYTNCNSLSQGITQQQHATSKDQRNLLSGKYKQYLRSQRMHPYALLPSSTTTSTSSSTTNNGAFPQIGGSSTSTMFQQVSCYNV